jgi:5-methylcytosine-specific restriction endonuclease McrA
MNCHAYKKGEKHQLRVDHVLPVVTHPHLKLVESNMRTLCAACDNARHATKRGGRALERSARRIGLDGSPIGEKWA